jgi:predicted GNAT superfamily acetyltransferase
MDIREIRSIDELHAVEALQREVWSVDDLEVLPAIHMIAASEVGAIIIGAFDGGELVAFAYGFPGFEGEHRVIHSDMLAVRDSYRDHGLGRALKFAQRDAALARRIDRITWTFDPLQSRNAYLNFVHLGVTADRYLRDFYGATTSPLHQLGTDRLWVTWEIAERRKQRSTASDTRRIEIPSAIANADRGWREKTRAAFEDAFAAGYTATGFERGDAISAYLLTR